MKQVLDRRLGRGLFGASADAYDRYRPAYPRQLYDTLRAIGGLAPGIRIFEVGAGTGQATRDLLEYRPAEYLAVEPDTRMADLLRRRHAGPSFTVQTVPFEQADLAQAHFDLGVSAMAFHWVDQDRGLAKASRALKPAGAFAMWWTQFGDASHPDAFYRAADPILAEVAAGPAAARDGRPHFSADREARLAALDRYFSASRDDEVSWTLEMSASALRGLFSTFSSILALAPERREAVLSALEDLARNEFGDRVVRQVTTRLYVGLGPRSQG